MLSMRPAAGFSIRVVGTLLLAWVAAQICIALHTPLPWMIGPLLATSFASIRGAPTLSWNPFRDTGQWVIGTALGLYFTPQVTALLVSLWWAIGLGIVWALLLGLAFGRWLHWVHAPRMEGLDRATTYFAGPIGGASEMTLLAERAMARTDLVASAHSLRVLIVTVVVPFVMQFSGWHGLDVAPTFARQIDWQGLVLLALCTGAGAGVMKLMKRPNPWFLGPFLVATVLTMNEITLSGIPPWLSNTAQMVIGVSLGVRFTASFMHTAPRWLASVALATVVMIVVCAGFAEGLVWLTGLPLPTMILSTSPGGIAEMAITAKVLHLGVAVVSAFQVCRLVAILLLVQPIYYWMYIRKP
jgi:membrane AbrB-like protein